MKLRLLKSVFLLSLFLTVQLGVHLWHAAQHDHAHPHETGLNPHHEDCKLCQHDLFTELEYTPSFQFFVAPAEHRSFYSQSFSFSVFSTVEKTSRGPPTQS